jgi:HAD superfamily hydrolase (TIGR01490 family)
MDTTETKKLQPVAVFDIDGTIFRSSLLIKLVEELVARGDFPESARELYQETEHSWMERSGSYEDYIQKVIEAFMVNLQGLEFSALHDAAKAVSTKDLNLRYRYTSKLITKLKKQGYYLLAVSQSPWAVLEDFCKSLGFDKVYGRFYELGANERFTGKVLDEELISDKAAIVKRAVHKHGLTLEGSFAVGDTEGDIPMLSIVENPICFNPNARLAEVARRNGWDIVIERKDVVYEWSGKADKIRIV